MPQSFSQIWLYLVFATKDRKPFLQQAPVRDAMFRMLSHHVGEIDCHPVRTGGWVDHVHLVCGLARTTTVADLVEHIKTETSKWVKKPPHSVRSFSWQAGYGAFSVSQSSLARVLTYVDGQAEHHRTVSFQDEFRTLCRLHGLELDERYAWD